MKTAVEYDGFKEFTNMMICKYPSILGIKGYSFVDLKHIKHLTILTDHFNMSLTDYIEKKEKVKIYTKTNDYIIILGITIALRYLEKKDIIHSVICPKIFLLDENLYPICSYLDINENMLIYLNDGQVFGGKFGNIFYTAPENLKDCISPSSIVFSYSLIVYSLLSSKNPFENNYDTRNLSRIKSIKMIKKGYRPDLSFIENKTVVNLLNTCWDLDPENRPPFDNILDIITKEDFFSYFEPFDHESVKKYLDIYGDEFKEIKNNFKKKI